MRTLAVLLLVTASAYADAPHDLVDRPLVLDAGEWQAQLVTEINDAPGAFAVPLSFAPDAWVGVMPRLTLGLVHSDPSVDRIAPGASICVHTDFLLCDKTYRGSGIDALMLAYAGGGAGHIAAAVHARLLLRDVDPAKPALTLGAALRWTHGRYALSSDPFVQLGLANTDRGNRSALWLPLVAALQPTCRWIVELHTGFDSDFAVIRDGWHIPIGLGMRAMATRELELGALFGFTSLLGPQNTPKERVAFVTVGWRS